MKIDKKSINFNVCHNAFYRGGQTCQISDLVTIKSKITVSTPKDKLPWLQVFDSGYRTTKDNVNWNHWNGTVFIDIDSKHYFNEVKEFNFVLLEDALKDRLESNAQYNFLNIQRSASGSSYHIMFYFSVGKSDENYSKCAAYAMELVEEAFDEIGASAILDYNGVKDTCSVSFTQGMFLSGNEIKWNCYLDSDEWNDADNFGKWNGIIDYQLPNKILYQSTDKVIDRIIEDSVRYNEIDQKIRLHYMDRQLLYWSLCGLYGNEGEDKVNEIWKNKIVPFLVLDDKTLQFYEDEPIKKRHFEKYNGITCSKKLLSQFGFTFIEKAKPTWIDLYNADVTYELDENQRLSDIDIEFKRDRINEIYAGCGFGKTYMAKQLSKEKESDTIEEQIDWLLNEGWHSKRICFISPLTSISKDSFEGVQGWSIIDGLHREDKFANVIEHSNDSICTTWESFCNYKMYDIDFDFVIVDEIHMIYQADYRINSITQLKKCLPLAKGIKIVMTGTPSLESSKNELDCYKIKVVKKQIEVKCDLILYNDNYRGYVIDDLKEWTKEEDHVALIFKDDMNHRDEEELKDFYGIDCDVYNKNYKDTVEWITEHQTVKEKVTLFSVYGQAGINLYPNENQKARVYILTDNATSIIQYANRIRNKEMIDKIVVPFKKSNVNSTVISCSTEIDIEEAKRRLNMIVDNAREEDNDPVRPIKFNSFLKIRYGFTGDCIESIDETRNEYRLREEEYTNFKLIKNVIEFERQFSIVYTRMKDNYIIMNQVDLVNDVPDSKITKQRTNRFSGQMKRLLKENLFKESKSNHRWYLQVDDQMRKMMTGDAESRINSIFNSIISFNLGDVETSLNDFREFLYYKLHQEESIKKSHLVQFDEMMKMKLNWDNTMNTGLIKLLTDDFDIEKMSAGYVSRIWKPEMTESDIRVIADETYTKMKYLKSIIEEYKDFFKDELSHDVEKLDYQLNDITSKVYTYLHSKHNRGKIGGKIGGKKSKKNNTKSIVVNGVSYSSKKEAMDKLNIGRKKLESLIVNIS